MREIKFRAWDKNKKGWIKDPLFFFMQNHEPFFSTLHVYQGIEAEVMQSTGLKDREECDVYEGDIVRLTYWYFDGNEAETELVGVVCYIPEEASYGLRHITNKEWIEHIGGKEGDEDTQSFGGWTFSPEDMQIIGNIYENPELLKV